MGAMGAAGNFASPAAPGGQPPAAEAGDDMNVFKQKIEKLKALKEAGMLSDEEFEQERKKLLDSL